MVYDLSMKRTTTDYRMNQADFKAEPWKQTVHNSKTVWISTCYDLIDGRWEGFVAMSFKKPVDA
jgi:hypothetical protein